MANMLKIMTAMPLSWHDDDYVSTKSWYRHHKKEHNHGVAVMENSMIMPL